MSTYELSARGRHNLFLSLLILNDNSGFVRGGGGGLLIPTTGREYQSEGYKAF